MCNKNEFAWCYRGLVAVVLSIAFMLTGCSSEDDGDSITVNIDGTDYTFSSCGQNSTGYEIEAGCNYLASDTAKRITFYKAYDANGGELKVLLTDIPDPALLDSPYGIEYECSTVDVAHPCGSSAEPTYDAASGTMTLSSVVVPFSNNRTLEFGTFVAEVTEHVVTTSVNIRDFPEYQ